MEKSNNKKKILTLLTVALALVIVLSCVIGIFGDSAQIRNYAGDNSDSVISTPLARPTTPTTGGFSYFADEVKYVFTNKDKVDAFRAGTEAYDITTITVNSSDVQGTQTNPHVITTIDEWEVFVKKMATDSTHGTGQYYVLGNDLDFDGETFHPVVNFSGTFYGLGYSMKNITCDTWQYWTGSAYANIGTSNMAHGGNGIFCQISNATITDLVVADFSMQNFPQNMTLLGTGSGPFIGAVAGISYGNDNVLNCHAVGEYSSTITYSSQITVGGVIGCNHASALSGNKLLMYRCSSEIDEIVKSGSVSFIFGGLLGRGSNANLYMYDCVSNGRVHCTGGTYNHTGIATGWAPSPSVVENIVGTLDLTTTNRHWSGALLACSGANVTIKNIYVDAHIGATDATKNSIHAVAGTQKIASASNINVVKDTASYATFHSASGSGSLGDSLSNIANEPHEYANGDLMLASAKSLFSGASYSNIWDTDKIG
ncbi:MAG: hypothetical protein K2I46_02915, partial [Clostridia bacterium]|nr:hypothetical protein [Clostridia bacterium]